MNRIWWNLFVCLALVLVGLAGAPVAEAGDSPTLNGIVANGKFRVGTSATQPPYTFKAKDGTLVGYEVALADLLADAMGVELELVVKPFPQLLPALEQGEVDAVMSGMTITPKRNLKAAFVGPYMISGKSILTKDETLAAADAVIDLDRTTVSLAALANSTGERFVKMLIPNAKLTTVDSYDEAVQLVLDDKVKAMVADYEICVISALRHQGKGLVTLAEPLTIEPIGIALPPGDSLLLNLIENYLAALDAVGVLDQLEARWFEDTAWLVLLP